MCVPSAVDNLEESILAGANVLELGEYSADSQTATFIEVTSMVAGTPYLVRPADDIVCLEFPLNADDYAAKSTTVSGATFLGAYQPTTLAAGDMTVVYFDFRQFYPPTTETVLPPFFPFLKLDAACTEAGVLLTYDPELDNIQSTAILEPSILVNIDNLWYKINGQRLLGPPTKPGLYIHHGRKVVRK